MESIRGTITKFVYKHPTSGWKVAKFKPSDGTPEFDIKGEIAESNLDFELTIKGDWVENGTYGRGFQVNNCIRIPPTTSEALQQWLVSNIKGIGAGMAKKIFEKFGTELRNVIETDPAQLAEIKGLTKATALNINMTWIADALDREVQLILSQGNISDKLSKKVIKEYGTDSVQVIQDNPYKLTKVSGIGFKTADKMALGMGWSEQRPERLDAAISFLLFEAYDNGHSFLHKSELIEKICRLAELEGPNGTELLPEANAIAAIDRVIEMEDVVLEVLKTGTVTHYLCYLPFVHKLEVEAATRIAELQTTPHPTVKNIDKILAKVEVELGLQLSDRQQDGVVSVLSNNCSIITGLPGTGKTSTVKALVHTARALGLAVQLAAPTGRAAKRLSEVTGMQALTIHRLLRFDYETGDFHYNAKNKLPVGMLILDEASMIDLSLMVSVLRAVPDDCSIAFIGDINQLPSVGAGVVLKDLINSRQVHTTVLDKIFRQAEGSLIIQNAHRIHKGEMPQFPPKGADGDSFWIPVPRVKNDDTGKTTDDVEFVKSKLVDIYKRLEAKGFDPVQDIQVLTPMRVGPAGYNVFNQVIQQIVNPEGERVEINGNLFRVGDRIMQTKNDYTLEVFNGDVGFVREVKMDEKGLLIEWSDRQQLYPFDMVENLALSYAVSVHKAQGSEFPVTIILLLNHHYVLLDRNMIYTAGTRAKKMCIYLASQGAMELAVKTQHVLKRNSLLAQRIKHAVKSEQKLLAA
jgi:exodeoxyribonuclease V alpha subunit